MPARGEGEKGPQVRVGEVQEAGPGACLPSISAPVEEIWLRDRLTVPISSWHLFPGLERNTPCRLSPWPSSDFFLPGVFSSLHPVAHQSKTLNLM